MSERMQDINNKEIKLVLDKWKHLKTIEGIVFDYKVKKTKKNIDFLHKRLERLLLSYNLDNKSLFDVLTDLSLFLEILVQ